MSGVPPPPPPDAGTRVNTVSDGGDALADEIVHGFHGAPVGEKMALLDRATLRRRLAFGLRTDTDGLSNGMLRDTRELVLRHSHGASSHQIGARVYSVFQWREGTSAQQSGRTPVGPVPRTFRQPRCLPQKVGLEVERGKQIVQNPVRCMIAEGGAGKWIEFRDHGLT